MLDNKLLRLPCALISARRRFGLLQKQVAIGAGLGSSYICALERGRRPAVPTDDVIIRIAKVFEDWPAAEQELRWAATHDRVLTLLDEAGQGDLAEAISAALLSAHALRSSERAGLARLLSKALGSRRFLERLEDDVEWTPSHKRMEAPID